MPNIHAQVSNSGCKCFERELFFKKNDQVNSAGDLEITEETVVGLIDQKIAEGKKDKGYEEMTLEEIDALEDEEDERVLQVCRSSLKGVKVKTKTYQNEFNSVAVNFL